MKLSPNALGAHGSALRWSGAATLLLAFLLGLGGCGEEGTPAQSKAKKPKAQTTEPRIATTPSDNTPPRIDSMRFDPQSPAAGDTLRIVVEASDADGDKIWLTYRWTVAGEPVDVAHPKLILNGVSKGDLIEVNIVASDGKRESKSWYASTPVGNAAPILSRLVIEPASAVVAGSQIVVRPEARDPDGDRVSFRYEWMVNERPVAESTAVFSTANLKRGDRIQVLVTASDGEDEGEPLESPEIPITNSPPRIVSTPSEPTLGGGLHYQVRAEDPDGDQNLQFHLEDPPKGMTIHPLTGTLRWVPSAEQTGKHVISVVVDDLQGGRQRQTFEIQVGDPAGESPPAASEP